MLELLIVLGLVAVIAVRVAVIRRAGLRRARIRAEAILDELAAAACDALAGGADPSTSRRCARAVDRYERTRDRVGQARTRRELEAVIARHQLRQGAADLMARGAGRVRGLIGAGVPARR